jgi:hypothetical protein
MAKHIHIHFHDNSFVEADHPRAKNGEFTFGKGEAHPDNNLARRDNYSKPTAARLDVQSEKMLQDAQANWFDNTTEEEKDESISVQKIKLADLKTVQFGVNNKKVEKLVKKFKPEAQEDKPWIDMFNGIPVISDGNHRVEAAIARGETHMEVNVRELTKHYKKDYRLTPPPKKVN